MRVFSWPLDEYLFILRGQDERGFSSLTKERSFNQRFTSTKRFNYGLWCFSKIFGSPKISTSPFLKATSLIKKRGGGKKKDTKNPRFEISKKSLATRKFSLSNYSIASQEPRNEQQIPIQTGRSPCATQGERSGRAKVGLVGLEETSRFKDIKIV